MGSLILKQGSKGKLVTALQKFLNLKGKLPKPIEENGDFTSETKEAVRYFQRKAGVKPDGEVGPETAAALAKLVGPNASSFVKSFGDLEDKDAKADAKNKEADKESTSPSTKGEAQGTPGKVGNVIHVDGNYKISIPPDPSGTFPMVLIFAGITHIAPVFDGTPPSYLKDAIMVFSEMGGSFSAAQNLLKPLLDQTKTRIGSISVCGYSGGGLAAFRDYSHGTKAVGLMDPSVRDSDLPKLDSKAIFSCNPDNWSVPKYEAIVAAQIEAGKSGKAGVYERTTIAHAAYPKYFLAKFESSLI
jgi:peptidoglycan hydrolase-like protein with peptidoglycan-binding domain